MYFVGLHTADAIHAVIFLVAVLYRPLIVLIKLGAKSKQVANLWLWSFLTAFMTVVAIFFIVFNLSVVGAPSSAAVGLGQQKHSILTAWRSLLPILIVMLVCALLTAHSTTLAAARSGQQKLVKSLNEPLLTPRDYAHLSSKNISKNRLQIFVDRALYFAGDLYEFFMRDCFRFFVSLAIMLRGVGAMSASASVSILRHGYLIIIWLLLFIISYHQQWNGNAARWSKPVWTLFNAYGLLVIGIRYLYYFVSVFVAFTPNIALETGIGLNRLSVVQYNIYLYFGADAALVLVSFVQSRRFLKLQKFNWQWPSSPAPFNFPKTEYFFRNLLSVHGDKAFLASLIAASLLNGVSVIGLLWALYFVAAVVSRQVLESGWAIALILSFMYGTLAVLAVMPMVEFPGQERNVSDECDPSCTMGFIGLQSVTPYNVSSCVSPPFYCQNLDSRRQLLVAICLAASVCVMRLGLK
jgi:hypothetical protein